MIHVNSIVRLNMNKITQLSQSAVTALNQTAEALHTEVVQAQVIPRDTGTLQNESTFVDDTNVQNGSVSLVSSIPYARRLYFHPEYHFDKRENPHAKGQWYEDWIEGGKKESFAKETFSQLFKNLGGI